MDATKIMCVIIVLLILLTIFQTFQLINISNRIPITGYTTIKTSKDRTQSSGEMTAQLPTQGGGC